MNEQDEILPISVGGESWSVVGPVVTSPVT